MRKITDIFKNYTPSKALSETVDIGEIESVSIVGDNKKLCLNVYFKKEVQRELIFALEKEIGDCCGVNGIHIKPKFNEEAYTHNSIFEILKEINRNDPSICNCFKDAVCHEMTGTTVIELKFVCRTYLCDRGVPKLLSSYILEEYGKMMKIELSEDKQASLDATEKLKKATEENDKNAINVIAAEKKEKIKKASAKEPTVAVLGNLIRSKPVDLKDVTLETGNVTVWGQVFGFTVRETNDGTKNIITFNITDKTGSNTIKVFREKTECAKLVSSVSDGSFVLVRGYTTYDKYDREMNINASHINLAGAAEGRIDTTPSQFL